MLVIDGGRCGLQDVLKHYFYSSTKNVVDDEVDFIGTYSGILHLGHYLGICNCRPLSKRILDNEHRVHERC